MPLSVSTVMVEAAAKPAFSPLAAQCASVKGSSVGDKKLSSQSMATVAKFCKGQTLFAHRRLTDGQPFAA